MRSGRRLALDPGSVRIGVAVSDPQALVATRREALRAGDQQALLALIEEVEPIEIIVGLPLGLDGQVGEAAEKAQTFARDLQTLTASPIRMVDERLSTVQAQRGFHAQGRSVRQSRTMIDSASAEVVLQHAMDAERTSGQPPGEVFPAP